MKSLQFQLLENSKDLKVLADNQAVLHSKETDRFWFNCLGEMFCLPVGLIEKLIKVCNTVNQNDKDTLQTLKDLGCIKWDLVQWRVNND